MQWVLKHVKTWSHFTHHYRLLLFSGKPSSLFQHFLCPSCDPFITGLIFPFPECLMVRCWNVCRSFRLPVLTEERACRVLPSSPSAWSPITSLSPEYSLVLHWWGLWLFPGSVSFKIYVFRVGQTAQQLRAHDTLADCVSPVLREFSSPYPYQADHNSL